MSRRTVILDSDTLSLLSRGDAQVVAHAREYLQGQGRLTITAVTVFERLRAYRAALRAGKPFEPQLRSFEALVANCIVLPSIAPRRIKRRVSGRRSAARLAARSGTSSSRGSRAPAGGRS